MQAKLNNSVIEHAINEVLKPEKEKTSQIQTLDPVNVSRDNIKSTMSPRIVILNQQDSASKPN